MISIKIEGENAIITVHGWHALWALRRKIVVPLKKIKAVRRAGKEPSFDAGIRMLGTSLPGYIVAGMFVGEGRREFWDVTFKGKSIEIDLAESYFSRLVVDVSDPDAAVRDLLAALERKAQ